MGNTYYNLVYHVIFSVKERRRLIDKDIESRLYSYIVGIAKINNFFIKEINGDKDHLHILLSLKTDMPISKAVKHIKAGSSKWIHENFANMQEFSWQVGYGVFTVSTSQISIIQNYIKNQKQHHKKIDFLEEYKNFLKKNNIDFDEKYLL